MAEPPGMAAEELHLLGESTEGLLVTELSGGRRGRLERGGEGRGGEGRGGEGRGGEGRGGEGRAGKGRELSLQSKVLPAAAHWRCWRG